MGHPQTGEGRTVLPGEKGPGSQQHGRSVFSGLFPQGRDQSDAQRMPQGGGPAGKGESVRGGNRQIRYAVDSCADALPEQFLAEIVAIRIGGTGGMIDPALEDGLHAGSQPLGQFGGIEGPVRVSAGERSTVQGHIRKRCPELAAGPGLDFLRYNA